MYDNGIDGAIHASETPGSILVSVFGPAVGTVNNMSLMGYVTKGSNTVAYLLTRGCNMACVAPTIGNQPSVPKPGTDFQVIGAGLSRTGTASFSEALRILLNGPVYHDGTQATLGPEVEIKSLIKVLSHFPPKSPSDKTQIHDLLKQRLDGYTAVTDAPFTGLVEELLEVYPDALVICTVRDPDAWFKSMEVVRDASTRWFLCFVLFPIPSMRYFVDYIDGMKNQWNHLYGHALPTAKSYEKHIEYLKRVVPNDRLVFFSIQDGWEPLCKALGKDVPKDLPFPRINDGEAIDRLAKRMVTKGLLRWLAIYGIVGAATVPLLLKW